MTNKEFVCEICGGPLKPEVCENGQVKHKCVYCGKEFEPEYDFLQKGNLQEELFAANIFMDSDDFDKAQEKYSQIINKYPQLAVGYLGDIRCFLGIKQIDGKTVLKKYTDTDLTKIPTYKNALIGLKNEVKERDLFLKSISVYSNILERTRNIIKDKKIDYDIFICFKQSDGVGDNAPLTKDYYVAKAIYDRLKDKFKVFFAPEEMPQLAWGDDFDPYIFAALEKSTVLFAVSSYTSNLNASWPKSEWTRFLDMPLYMPKGNLKIIPVAIDGSVYNCIPKELLGKQGYEIRTEEKINENGKTEYLVKDNSWLDPIISGLEELVAHKKRKFSNKLDTIKSEHRKGGSDSIQKKTIIDSQRRKGYLDICAYNLSKGRFKDVLENAELIINSNEEDTDALKYCLLAKSKSKDFNEFFSKIKNKEYFCRFEKTIREIIAVADDDARIVFVNELQESLLCNLNNIKQDSDFEYITDKTIITSSEEEGKARCQIIADKLKQAGRFELSYKYYGYLLDYLGETTDSASNEERAEIYWNLLQCDFRCKDAESLSALTVRIDENKNYDYAYYYATENFKEQLRKAVHTNLRDIGERKAKAKKIKSNKHKHKILWFGWTIAFLMLAACATAGILAINDIQPFSAYLRTGAAEIGRTKAAMAVWITVFIAILIGGFSIYVLTTLFNKDVYEKYNAKNTQKALNNSTYKYKGKRFCHFVLVLCCLLSFSVVGFNYFAVYNADKNLESQYDFIYLSKDNGYSISSFYGNSSSEIYGKNNQTDVVIPEYYKGKKVVSIESYAFSGCDSIENLTIGSNIKTIGAYAFNNCSGLTEITLTDNIEQIGEGAFSGCTSLKELTIPFIGEKINTNSVEKSNFGYLFGATKSDASKHSLGNSTVQVETYDNKDFNIPDSLKKVTVLGGSILDGAFADCDGIETVILEQGVKHIGKYAFYDCGALKTVKIGKSVEEIDYAAFHKCSALIAAEFDNGSTLKTIRNSAFNACSSLKSIDIPNSVTTIEKDVFYLCNSLSEMSIPFVGTKADDSENAFFGYIFAANSFLNNNDFVPTSLKKVNVTGGDSIKREAFYRCQNITSISIADSVKSIGVGAFNGCSSLEELTLPFVGERGDYTEASPNTLFGYIFGSDATSESLGCFKTHQVYATNTYADYYYIPSSLKTVNITGADGINILYGAFSFVKDIETVNFGSGVTQIPMNCFWQNRDVGYTGDLKVISMTDNVVEIGETAFFNCKDLTTIKLSNNLKSIGSGIFGGCDSLETTASNNVEYVASNSNTYFMAYKFNESSVSEVNLDENCVFIYQYIFSDCNSLTTVNIPESVKHIGNGAFSNCTSLTSLSLPDELDYLAADALKGCTSLPISEEGNALYFINKGKEMFIGVTSQNITYLKLKASVNISGLDFKDYSNLNTLELESEIDPYTISKKVNSGVDIVSNGKSYKIYKNIYETPQSADGNYIYIIDWSSCSTNVDYIDAVTKSGTRFGGGNTNHDIANIKEIYLIGNPNIKYSRMYIYLVNYFNGNDVPVIHMKDFNIYDSYLTVWCDSNYDESSYHKSVALDIHGNCSIQAGTGGNAIFGFNSINFTGDGFLTIKGGNGANATSKGANGNIGGTGIIAHSISVDMYGSLNVYGGNGGNGKEGNNGTADTSGGNNWVAKDFQHGQNGGSGGNGGRAIQPSSCVINIKNGYVVLIGGNGGDGANGGVGGSGYSAGAISATATPGGNGGAGGNAGNGGKAISSDTVLKTSGGTIIITSGSNGKYGYGASGGEGGDSFWGSKTANGATGANGSAGSISFYDGDRTYVDNSGIVVYGYNTLSNNEFLKGIREYAVYDNTNKGVKIDNISRSSDNLLGLPYEMKITSKLGSDNRHMGGYCGTPVSSSGASFYYTIYAKIPVGYSIDMYNNEIGEGAHKYWLTDNKGTGKWQWYIGVTECGTSGKFSTLGFVAIYANDDCTNANADNIVWYVGYSQVASYQPTTKNNTETKTEMEYNGHTYQVIAESLSWEQAKTRAEELGGHLVTITSEEENGIVKSLFANSGLSAAWLGASDSKVEGKWQWVTGEEFTYSYWGQIDANSWEPNGGNKSNALVFYRGNYLNGAYKWDDTAGENNMSGFIIEFES